MFIVLEGLDGSGKSLQAKKLEEYLTNHGIKVWVTAEPSNSYLGKAIRTIQSGKVINEPSSKMLAYLYAADRESHIKEIQSHLDKEEWVICDRYRDSSLAYQGVSVEDKKDLEILYTINESFLKEDLAILIDVPVEVALERINNRKTPLDIFEKKEFLEKVRNFYLDIFKEKSYNHYIIKGDTDSETVHKSLVNMILNWKANYFEVQEKKEN